MKNTLNCRVTQPGRVLAFSTFMIKNTFISIMLLAMVGCQGTTDDPSIDCNTYDLAISVVSVTDAYCQNADGSLEVNASGGDGKYTFVLNRGVQNETGIFSGISSGTYTITVSDGSPCSVSITATVNSIDGASFEGIELTDAGCNGEEGTITVSAMEGIPPYQYALNEGVFQENPSFNGLSAGEYTVRLKDSGGCETSASVQLLHGISWELEVKPIIDNNCAIPECHGGNQLPDFRDFDNVVNNAENIKVRTGNGSMPPNTVLDADDVQAIACWVDDGALAN